MRIQRRVDSVLDIAGPPRPVRTGRINHSNRELVEIFHSAIEGLTGGKCYRDFAFRVFRIQHLLLKLQAFETRRDAGEIADWRMAGAASARPFEISLTRLSIARLEVRGIHSLASTLLRERIVLLRMNEGHQTGNLLIGKFKAWHALVWASIARNRADLVS